MSEQKRENYTEADRERAVAAYVSTGSYTKAEKVTGIKANTIYVWRNRRYQAWWSGVEERLREEYEAEHRASLREIICLGMRELQDRIEHGDYVLEKDGKLRRKPVNARDLVIASGTMIDKLRVSLGQPTSISGKPNEGAQDKLESLKQAARDSGKLADMGPGASAAVTEKSGGGDELEAA